MKYPTRALAAALSFGALTLGGCASDGDSSAPKGSDEAAAIQTGKNTFNSEGYKADCIDCAEDGANAYIQAKLGDRFLQTGDRWQVAYLLRTDVRVQKQPLKLEQIVDAKKDVGLTVLDFEVIENGSVMVGTQERKTARIKITQGEARGSLAQLMGDDMLRVDGITRRIDLELDDLLRPVSVTEYTGEKGQFPNGRTLQMDPRETLKSISSAFPYVVPNIHVEASETSLPELPEELAKLAEASRPGYAEKSYLFFDMGARGLDTGEKVYWAKGDLWPYLVVMPDAMGVLVWQNK